MRVGSWVCVGGGDGDVRSDAGQYWGGQRRSVLPLHAGAAAAAAPPTRPRSQSAVAAAVLLQVAEARKICPDLVLVHVETIGADGASSSYAGEAAGGGGGRQGQETNRLTQKACLERYRWAGWAVHVGR